MDIFLWIIGWIVIGTLFAGFCSMSDTDKGVDDNFFATFFCRAIFWPIFFLIKTVKLFPHLISLLGRELNKPSEE